MSRFVAAGVPISVLSTPTSFLYGAQASEGIVYIANADSVLDFVTISDATGTPGRPVPLIPGEWLLLPYGAYNTIKTTNGSLVYAQPGFLNKKRFLSLNDGEDIFSEESQRIYNSFTTPATTGRKHLINMTVNALKAFSLWDIAPFFHVFAAETDQAGRINWKNPGTFTLINTAGTPAFAADRGFTVGSTSASNLGANGTLVTFDTVNNISYEMGLFGWNLTGSDPPTGTFNFISGSGGNMAVHINTTNIQAQLGSPNAPGYTHGGVASTIAAFHSARRVFNSIATANTKQYRNGQLVVTHNTSSVSPNTSIFNNLRYGNVSSTPGDFELALGGFFFTTTDAEHLHMYQVWQAYMSIIGAI